MNQAARPLSSSPSTPSALPLTALADVPPTAGTFAVPLDAVPPPLIHLYNATVALPLIDYLALLHLLLSAPPASPNPSPNAAAAAAATVVQPCLNATVQRHAQALSQGITAMALGGASSAWEEVKLSGYSGWGVSGAAVVVVPGSVAELAAACPPVAQALALKQQQQQQQQPQQGGGGGAAETAPPGPPEGSGDGGGGVNVGAVVGGVVGGVAALGLVAVGGWTWARRRRQQRSGQEQNALFGDEEAASADAK